MTKEDLQKIDWAIQELEQIETQVVREAVQPVIDGLRLVRIDHQLNQAKQ